MKKNLIIIILIIISIILFFYFNKEKFEPLIETKYDEINNYNPINKTCIVEIKYNDDGSDKFKYVFTKKENYDYRNFINTPLKRIFVEGINDWNNINCDENNNILGGCRNDKHECSNFMTKEECDLYHMEFYKNNPCTNNFNPDVSKFKYDIYNLDDYKKTLGQDNKEKDKELNITNYNPFLINNQVYLISDFDKLEKDNTITIPDNSLSTYTDSLSEDETSVNFDIEYKENNNLDPNFFDHKLF